MNAEDSYKNMVVGSMKMGLGVTPTILHVDSRNESFKTSSDRPEYNTKTNEMEGASISKRRDTLRSVSNVSSAR